jgi:hypothetical protein
MTLYTALGLFDAEKKREGRHPVVTAGSEKLLLDIPEMVIWATLKARFLEMPQLERLYGQRLVFYGLDNVPPCSAYIDRMLQRGLIAEGHGERGHDALYDLLSDLQIVPARHGFFSRPAAFLRMTVRGRMPLHMARGLLRKLRLSHGEKEVMNLCGKVRLSTAEVITCIENGHTDLQSEDDVVSALYSDSWTTYDNIDGEARACLNEMPCLTAIANLYLRQHISLER